MTFSNLGAKWRMLLLGAMLGVLVGGGAFLLPDAQAQSGPSLTADTVTDVMVIENTITPVSLFSNAVAATADSFTSVTVQVTGSPDGNSERLHFNATSVQFTNTGVVDGNVTATASRPSSVDATVVFTFGTPLTSGDFETFINTLGYRHSGNDVTDGTRTLAITEIVDSSGGVADPGLASTVVVQAVNDPPNLLFLPLSITVIDGVASDVDLSAAMYQDVDGQSGIQTLTITASSGTLTGQNTGQIDVSAPGPSLTLTGTASAIDTYFNTLSNMQYTSEAGAAAASPNAFLSFVANDGGNTGTGEALGFATEPPTVEIVVESGPDPVVICVVKELGSGAKALVATSTDFSFQLNSGTSEMPGPSCAEEVPAVQFLVEPGATVTISEVLPTNSPIRPVEITCSRFDQSSESGEDLGTVNLAAGSIEIDIGQSTEPIDCTFTNDALIVCVTKLLGKAANQIADTSDFTIDLLVAGQDPVALVPSSSDPMCGETEGGGMGIVGAALPPGTEFSLTERNPGSAIGLTSASCVAGEEDFEADLTTRTILNVSPGEGEDRVNRIDCEFRNNSVVVCVTKQFGEAVDESTLDEVSGSFAVTVDGEAVLSAITPFVGGEVDLCADGSQLRFGFNAAPGSEITLTETAPDGSPLRLVRAACGFEAEGPVDLEPTLVGQTVSFTLNALNQVDCTLTNDITAVCVTKLVSEDVAFGLGLSASDFGFTVTADGATMSAVDNVCSDENTGVGRAVTGYAVPPGSTVTVTENLSSSPAGLIQASCTVGESVIGGDLANRSVTVALTDSDGADCEFSNSVVVVCVSKALGANALAAGFVPTDFGFDIQVVDGTASPLSDPPCVQRRVEEDDEPDDEVISSAVFGFAVTPNAGFTITETSTVSATAPIALVNVSCAIDGITPTVDLDAGTVTLPSDLNRDSVSCLFKNDTALVCVGKSLDTSVVDAGYGLGNFSFQLQVDGQPVGDPVVPSAESDISSCSTEAVGADGVAALLAKPGTNYAVTELIADGVRADVTQATCGSLGNDFEPVALDGRTVTFTMALPSATVAPFSHGCDFDNVSIPITINKTVLNDNAGALTVADFVFDVFDADGELIATVTDPDPGSAGAVVYVAPGATFTITERSTDGYETTSAVCAVAGADQALAGTSVTYALSDAESGVECTFVNDDIAPIPVCAMLILDAGTTDFTLADFSLELFEDGAIIGQRTADGALDGVCEDQTDNTASLLPGSLVHLGDVFADGSSFGFVAAVADPDELLEFDPSSCTVDGPAALQGLTGPDAVMFTADPGATQVICIARAAAKPPVVQLRQSVPSRPIAVFEEPVVATPPAAAPLAVPATQVISSAIAVTGTSTTGVTMPVGLSFLAVGFAGLGLGRVRRRRFGDR